MDVDLILQPHFPAGEIARLGAMAESFGIRGVWATNHLDGRDPFVNFVPLALQTRKLVMGPTALSPFEVHPLKMASLLLTLNEIGGGRAQVAVGGGGGTLQAMGAKPVRMVRAVRECIEVLKLAASATPGPYRGEVFPCHWVSTGWARASAPAILAAANGPQMLRMGARYADGIMTSDFTASRLGWARSVIDPVLTRNGRDPAAFPLLNFWAWHVKESREAAEAEARTYLMARGTLWDPYLEEFVTPEEAAIVRRNYPAFVRAYDRRSPDIEGVPEGIVAKLVAGGVSASPLSDLDAEIERLRGMGRAGATGVVLCLYNDPAESIRIIGERVVPALRDAGARVAEPG